jgi:hypothetical protein
VRERANLLNSYVELLTCIEMERWKTDLGPLTSQRASGGEVGGAGGGSPPTPGQFSPSGAAVHPLGGSPSIHVR